MDDLTAADYRLLLSLLAYAIVAPDQRARVQGALESAHDAAGPAGGWKRRQAVRRGERGYQAFEPGEISRIPISRPAAGLCPAGGERN